MPAISDSLTLPCGVVLPNRLLKSAMTEGLATPMGQATARHDTLYRRWSEGGVGTLVPDWLRRGPRRAISSGCRSATLAGSAPACPIDARWRRRPSG